MVDDSIDILFVCLFVFKLKEKFVSFFAILYETLLLEIHLIQKKYLEFVDIYSIIEPDHHL